MDLSVVITRKCHSLHAASSVVFHSLPTRTPLRLEKFYELAKQYERNLHFRNVSTNDETDFTFDFEPFKVSTSMMQSPAYLNCVSKRL